jgi:heptosyltransferase-3
MGQNRDRAGRARRILVIFPGALGDLICLLPALRAISLRHPGWEMELMARAELAQFAVGRMGVARGHSIDRREVSLLFTEDGGESAEVRGFFGGFGRVYAFFAQHEPGFRRTLAAVAGGAVTFLRFRPTGTEHVAKYYLQAIGADDEAMIHGGLEVTAEDIAAASRTAASAGLMRGQFILICPGSGSPGKNWPAGHFAAIARRIEIHARPVILLGPAETAIAPDFRAEFVTLEGRGLGEVAGLARLAIGFLGNDSGVSHLAAAAGARGVVLFGPTDPARWRPLGDVQVVRGDPLADLPLEAVEARVLEILTIAGDDG